MRDAGIDYRVDGSRIICQFCPDGANIASPPHESLLETYTRLHYPRRLPDWTDWSGELPTAGL
jgi:hypothetical protein